MPEGKIWQVIERQRRELLRMERSAASEMVRAYALTWQRIKVSLEELLQAKAAAEAAGEVIDAAWLYKYERLSILQRHVEGEIRRFVEVADPAILAAQQAAVEAAQAHSAELVAGLSDRAGVGFEFARLPADALEDIVGATALDSPLRALLDALGPEASAAVRDALIEALATGQGAAPVARRIRKELGGNLVRALRIARTEILRAYRETTRRSYEQNDQLIDGWTWVCALTPRTCAACWAMHGTFHTPDEHLDDHPNGRCTAIPHLKTGGNLPIETGAEQFSKLDPAAQDVILGKAGGLAYREGAVELGDFVRRTRSAEWGTTRSVRALNDILGKEDAREWARKVKNPE